MSMYHLSYDIEDSARYSTEEALRSLVLTLVCHLGATKVIRPVASTLVFSSPKGYFDVLGRVNLWALSAHVHYVLSQLLPHEDGRRFYYTMRQDPDLQQVVDDYVRQSKEGGQ